MVCFSVAQQLDEKPCCRGAVKKKQENNDGVKKINKAFITGVVVRRLAGAVG
jgi:hypothetical protein